MTRAVGPSRSTDSDTGLSLPGGPKPRCRGYDGGAGRRRGCGEPLCREVWEGGGLEVSRVTRAHQDDQAARERQAVGLVLTE